MKHLKFLSALLLTSSFLISCERLGEQKKDIKGQLCISFLRNAGHLTRSHADLPDTNDFVLTIRKSDGSLIYDGKFGDCPEKLDVSAGTYTIKTVSGELSRPGFENPVFGDEQCVIIPAGGRTNVTLVCSQLNAGIRLIISEKFLTACPDAVLFLRSHSGNLMYSYSEKRTAYFPPGTVSLAINSDNSDEVMMTRDLSAKDMLTIKIEAGTSASETADEIAIRIDTSRVWSYEEYTVGSSSASSTDQAITVADARNSAGKEDVWVSGYIVGGDLTSASASFQPPFDSSTNLLLGPRSSTTDKNSCLSVQLPAGHIRDELNLAENPGMLKKKICIRGDIVPAYFGIPGLKNITEYKFN